MKWRGVRVWSHAGMICTGETYKSVVKMTFAKGAASEAQRYQSHLGLKCSTTSLNRSQHLLPAADLMHINMVARVFERQIG
jgi:hypothetical protein